LSRQDKITIASLSKAYGGSVTSMDELMVALDPDRFQVVFIFLESPGDTLTWMESAGHRVFRLSDKGGTRVLGPSSLLKLVHILRANKVDVLHCHNHKANLYGALAGAIARTPVILAQVHGLHRTRNVRRKLANLLIFRRVSRIVAIAEAVKQDILTSNWLVPAERLVVLADSVDYNRFAHCDVSREQARALLGLPADAFVFGSVGRLAPTKGLPFLIEAFSRVRAEIPRAHLAILGEGQMRAQLEEQAAATPCAGAIHFLGRREPIGQYLRGMDVFVMSSVAEGMGRALLEAMAAGVPVVATRVGGIPEVVASPDVGRLVPPRDPAALSDAMLRVSRMSGSERTAMATRAQERIRRCYSHEVIREKLAAIYEKEMERF
jgi:glycosyltransferase involved in cell wall biosynthesis